MKIEITKEWCIGMARRELATNANVEVVGAAYATDPIVEATGRTLQNMPNANIAFGRFIQLMRRRRRQTLEHLAQSAEIEVTELVEIEEDNRHVPEPRTVYQLAKHFDMPTPRMMQLAGLSSPKDARLYEEAIRFAARSEVVEDLNEIERAALEAFVSVLSDKK